MWLRGRKPGRKRRKEALAAKGSLAVWAGGKCSRRGRSKQTAKWSSFTGGRGSARLHWGDAGSPRGVRAQGLGSHGTAHPPDGGKYGGRAACINTGGLSVISNGLNVTEFQLWWHLRVTKTALETWVPPPEIQTQWVWVVTWMGVFSRAPWMLAEKAKGSKPVLAGARVGEGGQIDEW